MGEERLTLTIAETAKLLGIGRNLCYDLAKRGQLPVPVLRCGHRLLIPKRALERVLSEEPAPTPVQSKS